MVVNVDRRASMFDKTLKVMKVSAIASKLRNSRLYNLLWLHLRVRFFKKIQDWILKSEIIRKRILRFFSQQINPRSFGSRCLKGAEDSTPRVDSSVPLIHQDPRDLGLMCLVKKRKIRFRILWDLRIQSRIFLKKRTLSADTS